MASTVEIQPYDESLLDAIIGFSLRAWEPVFESIKEAMDPEVYREQHPDWRMTQRDAIKSVCADKDVPIWVATEGSQTVGFVALKVHPKDRMGEIYMIAVDPDFQRRGIATALTGYALAWFKQAGLTTVMVYCPRVLGQWFDGIRFYAAASSPRRSRRTWAGLR